MTDQTPARSLRSTPVWVKLVLVLSLGANLLIVGLVTGAAINFRKDGGAPLARIDGPNPFLRAMTRDDARQMRSTLRPDAGALLSSRREGREAMQAILAQLRAPDLNEAALRAAFARLSQANAARADLGQDAILSYLVSLDAPSRAAFADRLEDSLRRDRGGRPPRSADQRDN